jgi:hypothetical protein
MDIVRSLTMHIASLEFCRRLEDRHAALHVAVLTLATGTVSARSAPCRCPLGHCCHKISALVSVVVHCLPVVEYSTQTSGTYVSVHCSGN